MKNLKLGLFSLLAILAVSIFLTSCDQEIPTTSELSDNESNKTFMSSITAPDGISEDEAITWAQSLSDEMFTEVTEIDNSNIESRWCTAYEYSHNSARPGPCYCSHNGEWGDFCIKWCSAYVKYCGGWSGGTYRVIKYTQYRNCSYCG